MTVLLRLIAVGLALVGLTLAIGGIHWIQLGLRGLGQGLRATLPLPVGVAALTFACYAATSVFQLWRLTERGRVRALACFGVIGALAATATLRGSEHPTAVAALAYAAAVLTLLSPAARRRCRPSDGPS